MEGKTINTEYFEYIKCNLCGADDYEVKYSVDTSVEEIQVFERYSSSSGVVGKDRIVKCRNCGLIYVNPRLKSEIILGGYSEGIDENYVSQSEGRIKTFNISLKFIEKYAFQKGRILDIGAAAGFFLKVAKDNGWETYGVEPSKWLVDYGNRNFQVNMKQGALKDGEYPDDFFDVITMWDVLEHTADPLSELKEVYRILKPCGILVVNFPNINCMLARLAGRRWWFILSVHLYYFTTKTLKAMLNVAGFEFLNKKLHFQKLSFSYLIFRLKPYNKTIANFMNFFCNLFRLNNLQIPYYASQMNIVVRKTVKES